MNYAKTLALSGLLAALTFAAAGATYRISAPGGVGDVGALTNAIMALNAANNTGATILLLQQHDDSKWRGLLLVWR